MKALTQISVPYVDLVILGLLVFGIFRGRKKGMSGELIDLIMWVTIVLAASFGHQPLGDLLRSFVPDFGALASYVTSYLTIIGVLALVFASIKRSLGEKLSEGDIFGVLEYYLGMVAGLVRLACIVVAALALIHARQYTKVEVQAREKQQEDDFGSIRFFRLYSLQADIFQSSFSGKALETFCPSLLIKSTPPGAGGATPAAKPALRERRFNELP